MSKQNYNKIEYQYICNGWSVAKIVQEFNISRRTVFYWKKKYNWDERQQKYFDTIKIFETEFFQFKGKLLNKLSRNLDNKIPVNQADIYLLLKLIE